MAYVNYLRNQDLCAVTSITLGICFSERSDVNKAHERDHGPQVVAASTAQSSEFSPEHEFDSPRSSHSDRAAVENSSNLAEASTHRRGIAR